MESPRIPPIKDPIATLSDWLKEAQQTSMREPNAMTLSTSNGKGELSSRVVLMKSLNHRGLTFYTNYNSQKGRDLEENPNVAINFNWLPIYKQVSLRGQVTLLSRQENEEYWRSRPKESQASQFISQQSQPMKDRLEFEQKYLATLAEYKEKEIPCPKAWGGYLVAISSIEFWLAHPNRLHDRWLCQKVQNSWEMTRLQP